MHLKKDLELAPMSVDCLVGKNIEGDISFELETLFNNVMSTVVNYFEEAVAE